MTPHASRVLAIGLDGATFAWLLPLAERGYLPNLQSLMGRGCWGRLDSTTPPFTATAWSTFATGQEPGQHGVLSFRKRDRFNYDLQGSGFLDASRFDVTLWEIMSRAEKRVSVVNVPLTYPPRPVNGYLVSGMLTPTNASQYTYPPDLARKIDEGYLIDVSFIRDEGGDFRRHGFPAQKEMLAQIHQMLRMRLQTCIQFLQEEAWDFFTVVFTGTDRIGHFFWEEVMALCQGKALHNAPIQEALLAYFRELDRGMGRLMELAGTETSILFLSDHGFGPAPTRRLYLNLWLEALGLLQRRRAAGATDLEYWRVWVGRHARLKRFLRWMLPQSTQDKATTAVQSGHDSIIDWSHTQAYWVPIYFHISGIEINLRERHRQGNVASGAPYETLREQIIAAAGELTDPVTGEKMVEWVARREDVYAGPYVEEFPDIIVALNPDYVGAGSLAGSRLVEPHEPFRSGEHRQDGIFIAAGPTIAPGEDLPGLRLLDVPPTLLYLLDLPIPTTFNGRLLSEIIDPQYLASHPPRAQEPTEGRYEGDAEREAVYSVDEEAELERRLRGLGYLD